MNESYERVMADPNNLLRPWSFDQRLREFAVWQGGEGQFLPCPTCGGRVRLDPEAELLVCTKCGTTYPMISDKKLSGGRATHPG